MCLQKKVAIINYKLVDKSLMTEWICIYYRPFTQCKPSMIVMDSFCAHLTVKVKKTTIKAAGTPAIILGDCTSVIQPLDVSMNKRFKNGV